MSILTSLFTDEPRDLLSEGLEAAGSALARVTAAGVQPLAHYQRRPVDFLRDVLGIPEHTVRWSLNPGYKGHTWDGTPDPLVAALEALAEWKDVGVEAGTGTQKTYVLGAAGVLWFLATYENAVVVTVAPKKDQLTLNLWKELGKLWARFQDQFPAADLTQLKLRMRGGIDESWAATGFVAGVGADEESANKARGFHAEHMLFVFEETPGVHSAIMAAIENTCTAPHNLRLALGNPDNQQDELHRFCLTPGVVHVRISAHDHPNVVSGDASIVPGAASRSSNERRALKYGRGSAMYDRMVRGISPKQAADSLVQWDWCVAAAGRYWDKALRVGLPWLGVDVANSENGDKAAIARGVGAVCLEVTAFQCPNASDLGKQVATEIRVGGTFGLGAIPVQHVGVDAGGVGASTVNKLKEEQLYVQALHFGASAEAEVDVDASRPVVEEERFNNLRAQMYWTTRMDLQHGRVGIPDDEELFQDLCAPKWWTRNGVICVESKEEIRKRLGRSTDKGDAFVVGNWVRRREALPEEEPAVEQPKHWDHDFTRVLQQWHAEPDALAGRPF